QRAMYAGCVGGDAWAALGVGCGIQLDAEPCSVFADALAEGDGILADAGGENEGIQPAERGGNRSQLTANAITIKVEGQLRRRFLALKQGAHIAGDARDAKQSRLAIEHLLDGPNVHFTLIQKKKD